MPLTSSVMSQSISNFRLYCCSKKIQMLRKKVKLLLEQLQVCIFAEIVFGVRCTFTLLIGFFILLNVEERCMLFAEVNEWMDGWMDGRMDGRTDGRMSKTLFSYTLNKTDFKQFRRCQLITLGALS